MNPKKDELRKRLSNLINNAQFKVDWDCLKWKEPESKNIFGNQHDWNQTLIVRINEMSANVRRLLEPVSGIDCVICSIEAFQIVSEFEYYKSSGLKIESAIQKDFFEIGQIGGRFKVYVDSYLPANIIIGGRESDIFDFEKETAIGVINVQNIFKI